MNRSRPSIKPYQRTYDPQAVPFKKRDRFLYANNTTSEEIGNSDDRRVCSRSDVANTGESNKMEIAQIEKKSSNKANDNVTHGASMSPVAMRPSKGRLPLATSASEEDLVKERDGAKKPAINAPSEPQGASVVDGGIKQVDVLKEVTEHEGDGEESSKTEPQGDGGNNDGVVSDEKLFIKQKKDVIQQEGGGDGSTGEPQVDGIQADESKKVIEDGGNENDSNSARDDVNKLHQPEPVKNLDGSNTHSRADTTIKGKNINMIPMIHQCHTISERPFDYMVSEVAVNDGNIDIVSNGAIEYIVISSSDSEQELEDTYSPIVCHGAPLIPVYSIPNPEGGSGGGGNGSQDRGSGDAEQNANYTIRVLGVDIPCRKDTVATNNFSLSKILTGTTTMPEIQTGIQQITSHSASPFLVSGKSDDEKVEEAYEPIIKKDTERWETEAEMIIEFGKSYELCMNARTYDPQAVPFKKRDLFLYAEYTTSEEIGPIDDRRVRSRSDVANTGESNKTEIAQIKKKSSNTDNDEVAHGASMSPVAMRLACLRPFTLPSVGRLPLATSASEEGPVKEKDGAKKPAINLQVSLKSDLHEASEFVVDSPPHTSPLQLGTYTNGYSSKNYVRKFLIALHPKWRVKVTAIEESKDLTSLSLDELIGNLKVREMIIKKDSKIVKVKVKSKSLVLKAKKESSDEECSTSRSEDEEYAMATFQRSRDDKNGKSDRKCFRSGNPNHLIGECLKPPKDKNQRAFVGGSWSDNGEEDDEKVKNETCIVAQASSEVCFESSYFSNENSSIDDLALDNEYDKLCKMSLKIIIKNKRLKATRNRLEKELKELKDKLSTIEKNKGDDLICIKCQSLRIENKNLKEETLKLTKFEKSTRCLHEMLSNQKPSGNKLGLGFNSFEASSSRTKEIKFVKAQKEVSSDGGLINMGSPLSVQARPKAIMGPPPVGTPGSEKSVSLQKSILGPRPKHITVNKVKVSVASDNEVKQFYKPLSKPRVGFSKRNFRSKTPPPRRVNNNYLCAKTPQLKRNIGRHNQPHDFPIKDSGCSKHITGNRKLFSSYKAYNGFNVIFSSNLRGNIIGKGYSQNNKAYIILNKHTKKIKESLNVTFDETPSPSKTSPLVDDDLDEEEAIRETKKKNLENVVEDETLEIDEIVNIKESRNHPLEYVIGNLNQITLRSQAQNQSNFFCFISTIEPKNVNKALGDESWIVAMQEELNQFIANDVWELARLVAQDYNQQKGIDYDETYAPVARLESIRILLAYACALDFKLFQMDVKSEFLNSFINKEVYVAQLQDSLILKNQIRPDIMFSVCLCARFQEAPKTFHLKADKRIFRYIKGTTDLELWYPKGTDIETVVYADSDHARDYVDRKSTSGICTFVGCCLKSWFSKKQAALAISTTEAEYVRAEKACQ
uniref:Gag-Pol polyprotein n=1 Tax=Tanacetum cinerariifolium TaxID=118510 RepID=A0A6L2N158_TANCI|nr:Gag-Pol polyprotein [Tanacetum cinerariifolium]